MSRSLLPTAGDVWLVTCHVCTCERSVRLCPRAAKSMVSAIRRYTEGPTPPYIVLPPLLHTVGTWLICTAYDMAARGRESRARILLTASC